MIKKIKDDSWKDIHDPYQITYDIFHRTRKNNPKMYMKQQKTQTSQGNLEGKKIKLEASRLQSQAPLAPAPISGVLGSVNQPAL